MDDDNTRQLSKRNRYVELKSWQLTGCRVNEEGVYLRLMKDRQDEHHFDLRYFGYDVATKNYKPTPYGVKFNKIEGKLLADLLVKVLEEIK